MYSESEKRSFSRVLGSLPSVLKSCVHRRRGLINYFVCLDSISCFAFPSAFRAILFLLFASRVLVDLVSDLRVNLISYALKVVH